MNSLVIANQNNFDHSEKSVMVCLLNRNLTSSFIQKTKNPISK